jgi:3-hydroxybutyryl-CoA dehydratase
MAAKHWKEAVPVGTEEVFAKTVTETDVYLFAGITGDFYEMHTNEEFASNTQFGNRIAHGAYTIGLVSVAVSRITKRVPPPGAVYYRNEFKFTGPVKFGDTITSRATVSAIDEQRRELYIDAHCTNQRDEGVMEGKTVVKILKTH